LLIYCNVCVDSCLSGFLFLFQVHAAVSNSAPLELKVDFPEYLDKLGSDLRYEKIGGSQQCFDIVKNGHSQAVQRLQETATRQALAEQFNVCHPTTALDDRNNQNLFVGDGLIGIDVQDNDPSCTHNLCNVEKLCGAMVTLFQSTNQTELEILADIARQQRGNGTQIYDEDDDGSSNNNHNDNNCVDVDWKATLKALSEPRVTNGGWRSWLWQTCTEVGFYQTCQHETCPYASFYHLVDMDLEICQAAYNITPPQVYSNIQASLDHYGDVTTFAGGHGNACNSVGDGVELGAGGLGGSGGAWRRVLTVHGDVDPWGVLGLQPPASTRDMPVKMVKGASHHFWTHAVHETDAPEIERIREYIVMVVLEWLSIDTTTTVSVVDS
jgi:thymus-specific serine protease